MEKTFAIEGMSCGHCKDTVQKQISGVTGVESCEVSLEKGEANVQFDNNTTSAEEIVKAVNDTDTYSAKEKQL